MKKKSIMKEQSQWVDSCFARSNGTGSKYASHDLLDR